MASAPPDEHVLCDHVLDSIIRFDRQHRHVGVESIFRRSSAAAESLLVGKTHRDLGLPMDMCERLERAIDAVFEKGDVHRVECQMPSGMWVDWLLAPELDERGAIMGIISLARDVTARKQAELSLRESERTFRALTEHSLDTIMRFDREHRHLYVNPVVEAQTGIAPAEFIGKTHRELGFPESLCALWEEALDKTFHEGAVNRIEFELPSGLWIDWVLAPEVGPTGRVDAVITSARDITARKQAEQAREEQARQAVLEERRRRYVEQIITAQEQERRRVARELHDVTGQTLTGLLVGLRAMEELDLSTAARERVAQLRQLTSIALDEVASLARGLHPTVLDDYGLPEALKRLAAIMSVGQTTIDVQVTGFDEHPRLPAALESTLYRIAQEAVTNVAKHAHARTVSVILDRGSSEVRLVIEDDGRGFDVAKTLATSNGLGLRSITERTALWQGQVTMESSPEAGTAIFVRIPSDVPTTGVVQPH